MSHPSEPGRARVSASVLAADRPVYLYIESDGMVKLVRRGEAWAFPLEGETDLKLEFQGEMEFAEGKVLFAIPTLDAWPRDWTFKDDVPGMRDVEPIVQRAINASLVREVVGALVFHPDGTSRILLVKASRGFTKGMWNIPGGFVTYGESPEASMRREMEEETGLGLRLEKLLGVFTQKFGSPYFMRGHMFAARATDDALRLKHDEIADARWLELEDARKLLMNPFARQALAALDEGRGLTLGA